MRRTAPLPSRPRATPRRAWRRVTAIAALAPILALSGCTFLWWGGDDEPGKDVSVFELAVGDCTVTPADVTVELTELRRVECSDPHQQELFAVVPYRDPTTGEAPDAFPGNEGLTTFADGECATGYAEYVGVDYRDSRLFYTYLLPSARGWEQDGDRHVLCFVTSTGDALTQSVKNTQW